MFYYDIFVLDNKDIADPDMVDLLRTHHQRSKVQFELFKEEMESGDQKFYQPIKKNSCFILQTGTSIG